MLLTKSKVIKQLLLKLDIHPVLMDVGASGSQPEIWDVIAQRSIYVGFDPDLRDLREVSHSRFFKEIIINKAIAVDEESNEVLFYFTKSPYCSSTLKPDYKSLSNFIFSDFFIVEKKTKVSASSLDSIMDHFSLSLIDWLKIDSQGTDLRIFNSLRDEVRSRVLAIDIEPGLIDAYIGEDLFVDAHRDLSQKGFWLSNMNVHGAVRMKRSTLSEIMEFNKDINCNLIEKSVRSSPGWIEARYFRTIEWLARGDFTRRDYVLLWIFALLDNQLGFAIDLGIEYEKLFGRDKLSQVLKEKPILLIRRSRQMMRFAVAKSILPIRIKRWLKKIIQ